MASRAPFSRRRPAAAGRRGVVLLYVTFALPVLLGIGSLALDVGRLMLVRSELQRAADAGARYGAAATRSGRDTALSRASSAAAANDADGAALNAADVTAEYGRWDAAARSFAARAATSYDANAVRVTVRRDVTPTFASVWGGGPTTVSAASVAYLPGVLFVAGNANYATMPAKDLQAVQTLYYVGYAVDVKTAGSTVAADATGRAAVVVSESIKAGDLGTRLRDVAVPVVSYEPYQFPSLSMTGNAMDTDYGWHTPGDTRIQVIDAAAFGEPAGSLFTIQNSVASQGLGFGRPGPAAHKYANVPGNTARIAVFTYDKGETMVGRTAPHRRVGLCFNDMDRNTDDGWAIFIYAVQFAVGINRAVVTVQ